MFCDAHVHTYVFAIVKGLGDIKRSLVWSSALRKRKREGGETPIVLNKGSHS